LKILLLAYFATWLFVPWILFARKRPISTLAWIWTIILFPFLGPIAYLLFGVDRITRVRRKMRGSSGESAVKEEPGEHLSEEDARLFKRLSRLNEVPMGSAHGVTFLPNASTFYPALEKAIREARHHIHIQFFIWETDDCGRKFLELLVAAARRGVAVRLLLDRIGSKNAKAEFFRPLVEAGGKVSWFRTINPLRNDFSLHLRNHRKLQIVDARIAFVGGMNIGKEYQGENADLGFWRDSQIELRGNVVITLQHVFAEDWYFAEEEKIEGPEYFPDPAPSAPHAVQVLLGGPDLDCDSMAEAYVAMLVHTRRRAWLSSGYFSPDDRLLAALRLAALGGADVRLLNTLKSDHPYLCTIGQSYYEELLRAGVRIFEYEKGINHAKTLLLDEDLLMVGSANCDDRSLRLNFELSVLVHCPEAARALEADYETAFAESREIDLKTFRERPFRQKCLEAIFRPFAPVT
jgi:cardiolipin synthase